MDVKLQPIRNLFWPILLIVLSIASLTVSALIVVKTFSPRPLPVNSPSPTPSEIPTATNKCVEKSSLHCAEEPELSFECTEEYQSWARANCPGWQEKVECTDPRPEVCTMECAQTPPYICGSDGNSYCSTCQACSNKGVAWYEMKASACEEGQFCGGITGKVCPEGYSCKYDGNYPDAGGVCTIITEEIPAITKEDLSRGWYWGFADQRKPNTPDDWIFTEAGRSSSWHKPNTQGGFLPD